MFQKILFVVFLFSAVGYSQEYQSLHHSEKIATSTDTIQLQKFPIQPDSVEIYDSNNNLIDASQYYINPNTGKLRLSTTTLDSVKIKYTRLPYFLTKTYSAYDLNKLVENGKPQLYRLGEKKTNNYVPFDGLNTSGSISRGMTIGNNQNSVLNSNLDLQVTGKLSEKVSLRASLQDTNIPLQEGGYSQKIDEFDQIFIELFSQKWNIRAGDIFLENRQSKYLNFNKKVQGLSTHFMFGNEDSKTDVFASAALVRGQYAKSTFVGEEGNQGPYKLKGANGELYVLVISGSESVYVNGRLLQRGENNDYIIDYNAGEIIFTSLFPISSEMRISIEYQYSDRNFTRFVTYGGATHTTDHWKIGGFLYSENDMKNQPLQQNLSSEQVQILAEAGNDPNKMYAPSAYIDSFSENKILYKKVIENGETYFEYSNNPDEVLYNVKFSLVGANKGNYTISNQGAIGKIYQYIAPIGNQPQGNYEPITKLIAPTKIQIASVIANYNPSEKTKIELELGLSNNDQNLYSRIDDQNNQGIAGDIAAQQRIYSGKITMDVFTKWQFIQENFKTIERLFDIEFNRDWNITTVQGNQSLMSTGMHFTLPNKGLITYRFDNLNFSQNFNGNKHSIDGNLQLQNWTFNLKNSFLKSDGSWSESTFNRTDNVVKYHWKKNWISGSVKSESNKEILKETRNYSNLSQRFSEFGTAIGRGDSTNVFVEIGYLHRMNDSLVNGYLKKVNYSNTYFLKSQLINNDQTNLNIYVNYRDLKYVDTDRKNEPSINSRLTYNDRYFDQFIQVNTNYENTSGSIAQQEFTYLEVEPGQGIYTWIDYNFNGIQELEEFEVAAFPDQAKYVKIFLPNQIFLRTHQNKFSQSVTLNPIAWQNKTGFLKTLSHFYNQTSYVTDRKIFRDGNNFDFNPFATSNENLLGLNTSFRNSLFYNRGKQQHSVTYNYLIGNSKNLLTSGSQANRNKSHQLQYAHLVRQSWLFSLGVKTTKSTLESENYSSKNYQIDGFQLAPKISYLFSKNASLDIFYEYQTKKNKIAHFEQLNQTRLGSSFTYNSEKKLTMNGEFSMYNNQYNGDPLAPVSYQILEGLQPGKNYTWRVLVQKNLTQYLDLNINYQARKSDDLKTIHTGNVQLRAFF